MKPDSRKARGKKSGVRACTTWAGGLLLMFLLPQGAAAGGGCPDVPVGGGENIQIWVSMADTGEPVTDGMTLPASVKLRLDARAEALGQCNFYCPSTSGCYQCATYDRTINHLYFDDSASTAAGDGTGLLGRVFGHKVDSSITAYYHVLDTRDTTTSFGPIYAYLHTPGTHTIRVTAPIDTTICNMLPGSVGPATITVYVGEKDDAASFGPGPCRSQVGEPINVTSGNMYVRQSDYDLPGAGGGLHMLRTYNSGSPRAGLFGLGWTSNYEESINDYGKTLLRLNLGDGRAVYFARSSEAGPFLPKGPPNFPGQVVRDTDGTHTLTLIGGAVHRFDAAGKLVSLADRNGNRTSLAYDADGRLLSVTDPSGRTLTLIRDGNGRVSSISDGTGVVATYTYGLFGWLASVRYPDGSGFDYAWNYLRSRLGAVRDALGNVLEGHDYDGSGRAFISERDFGRSGRVTLNYVGPGETHVTDGLGRVTKYFNERRVGVNVVTRVEGPCACGDSTLNTWTYDARLNVTSYANALGQTTTATYDANDNLLTIKDPLGQTTSFTYDAEGHVLTVTDPAGGVTANTYDPQGNLLSTRSPVGAVTTFAYDPRGLLLTATNPLGKVIQFEYDANGNPVRRTDPLGYLTTFAYDPRGRLTSGTDPLGNRLDLTYDAVGRLDKVLGPDGSTLATYAYDLAGRMTRVTDAKGNSTAYAYDAAYRLTTVTDAAGGITSMAYDLMDNLTSLTDARGKITSFEIDGNDRITKVTYPGGAFETVAYDTVGRPASRTDRRGIVTTYTFDAAGRLTGKSYSDGTPAFTYGYDAAGRLFWAASPTNVLTWGYNSAGQVLSESSWGLSGTSWTNNSTIKYVYDLAGQRTALRIGDYPILTYGYDSAGHLETIRRGTDTYYFGHDGAGRRTYLVYPNTTFTSYEYDAFSRLTNMSAQNWVTGVTLSQARYAYDATGNAVAKTTLDGRETYAYDALDRLTGVSRDTVPTESYEYDAVGNRLSSLAHPAWAYGDRNELLSFDGTTLAYDANGNLSQKAENGSVWSYEWDAENLLRRVLKDAVEVAIFAYDPLGRRLRKATGAVTTSYAYDGEDILWESASNGASALYIHGPGVDEPLTRMDGSGFSFYNADGLGSIVGTTDRAGTLVAGRRYDAFGAHEVDAATGDYAFTGREWDPETRLYYYRARYYDAKIGRFISEDPIGLLGGLNLYQYAGNNPVNFTDPSGLFTPPNHAALDRFPGWMHWLTDIRGLIPSFGYQHHLAKPGQSTADMEKAWRQFICQQRQLASDPSLSRPQRELEATRGTHAIEDGYAHNDPDESYGWSQVLPWLFYAGLDAMYKARPGYYPVTVPPEYQRHFDRDAVMPEGEFLDQIQSSIDRFLQNDLSEWCCEDQ